MNSMVRMFSEAMCLPITTFATGMETMARAVQCGGWSDGWRWSDDRGDGLSCADRYEDGEGDRCGWSWNAGCGDGKTGSSWSADPEGWSHGCSCGCDCHRCRRGDCCRPSHRGCDDVKLVEYTLVRVDRQRSKILQASRQEVISDCTSLEELRHQVIVDYAREHRDVDGRHLRVFVRVLACWRKDDRDFEDDQIDALHEIRDAIRDHEPAD